MKITAGIFKNRSLVSPKGETTRPTSERLRQAVFNICKQEIEGALFLDLFAGSGAIGFEAISHGATSVTFVENAKGALQAIKKNGELLGLKKEIEIFFGDVFDQVQKLEKKQKEFDIIFADPPYDTYKEIGKEKISFSTHLLKMIDQGSLLKKGGTLFIEDSSDASANNYELTCLRLQSSRRLGRSLLNEYLKL